ncbi:MAG: hypothetical protein P1V19_23690, partial [Gimesia sp.]|nr:hypothetical protein [Gimesia sp.]
IYADLHKLKGKSLLGCSKSGNLTWWVACSEKGTSYQVHDLIYKLWECILNWADRLSPIYDASIDGLGPESILIDVKLPNVQKWNWHLSADIPPSQNPSASVNMKQRVITLTIPEGFLPVFHNPKNSAEKEILSTLIMAVSKFGKNLISKDEVQSLVHQVSKGDDARFFHVMRSYDLEMMLADPGRPDVTFVPPEDVNNVQIGLADLVGRPNPEQLGDREAVGNYIEKTVEKIWERIEARMHGVNLGSIVTQCFLQIDQIRRERIRWESTARANLALSDNSPKTFKMLREKFSDLTYAEIGNRLIIETACYAATPDSKKFIAQTDHSLLLAEHIAMLHLANHRDVILGGFMDPNLTVHP